MVNDPIVRLDTINKASHLLSNLFNVKEGKVKLVFLEEGLFKVEFKSYVYIEQINFCHSKLIKCGLNAIKLSPSTEEERPSNTMSFESAVSIVNLLNFIPGIVERLALLSFQGIFESIARTLSHQLHAELSNDYQIRIIGSLDDIVAKLENQTKELSIRSLAVSFVSNMNKEHDQISERYCPCNIL